jgi:hypothetical membrane protein
MEAVSPTTTEQIEQARNKRRLVRPRFLGAAGTLLALAGLVALAGIMTAEALYPAGYSAAKNTISDLGATAPPRSVIHQPSATIFDTAMIVTGLLMIAGSICLARGFRRAAVAIFTGLTGLGILGVGLFPGNYGNIHAIFALLTFFAGGLAAITSLTVSKPPFSVLSTILGIVSLASLLLYLILGDSNPLGRLGIGGVERWIAYPILIWILTFGGYVVGRAR